MKIAKRTLMIFFLVMSIDPSTAIVAFGEESDRARPSPADLSIERLMDIEVANVYGASKIDQKVTEAPSSVTIVDFRDIKRYGYRTLADILRSVPGFFTTYDRNYSYAGVRGFSRPLDYNTRLLLLVDGHRINDGVYDSAFVGPEFILDVDLIDRVEVIRGPGSSLYGNNAFFGVINVITKQAQKYNGFELSGEAASFDTYKQRATYGKKFSGGFEMLLSGTRSTSKGQSLYFKEFDAPATNNGRADSCDHERYGTLFANLKHEGFTLQGAYVSREKGIPTASFGTVFNDNRNKTVDERGYIDLKYNKDINEKTNLKARAFYDYYNYEGKYLYDYPPLTMNRDMGAGKWWGGQAELTGTLFEKHKVVTGIEYTDYYSLNQRNYDESPYFQYLNDDRNSYIMAAYIQDQFSILDNLILNVGVRHDYYKVFGNTTNPRIGLIYSPFEQTAIKAIYGTAFRAPNIYELYYQDGGISQKANPGLKPEKIETYELILEQYVRNYRFSASGYYYQISDLISLQADPADGLMVFRNSGDIEAKGVELQAQGKWAHGIEARVSYAVQQSTDKDTGRSLANSPRNLAKANLFAPIIGKKLSAGFEVQYVDSRRTFKGDTTGGYVIANLTLLSQELIKNMEISGSLYNLFDKKYGDPASIEHQQNVIVQDGRTFRLKLTYRF